MSKRILIVEDEESIADLEEDYLELSNFEVEVANDGNMGLQKGLGEDFDLIILDLMLPGVDGFSLMEYIRPTETPVIFLTAKSSVEDRVRGLRAGAYDYIVKPCAPDELLARVDGLMRHTGRRSRTIRLWDVEINPDTRTVSKKGVPVSLTPREFDLLMALVLNRGIVLYRDVLFERVWGLDSEANTRTLDIHISRLRKKLGWEHQLRSVPKIGYLLEAER